MNIIGYDCLGQGKSEGIRFAWKADDIDNYIESAAFFNRTKGKKENICGYTTSVSAGCILKKQGLPCSFCRTGNVLPFGRLLTAKEIAQQNVFMVLCDINCGDHPELRTYEREFAYMGQGEPGYSYNQVRLAIEITNRVMKKLGQKVCRHIFATSGITEAIKRYKEDISGYFSEKVTLHLSMHSLTERDSLMPINTKYPIRDAISLMQDLKGLTGEKPCVGILLLKNFCSKNGIINYSNDKKNIQEILDALDPENFRLSFCDYNPIDEIGTSDPVSLEEAEEIIEFARAKGFESKYFSSFGQAEKSACGMLGGKVPDKLASDRWKEMNERAIYLVNEMA